MLNVDKKVKWFIASDNSENLGKIKKLWPDKVIHANGSISHVYSNQKGYMRAFIDVELLALCDELIITGGSTFGFVSVLRNGRYPLFVNGKFNAKKCDRFSFANPSRNPNSYAVI